MSPNIRPVSSVTDILQNGGSNIEYLLPYQTLHIKAFVLIFKLFTIDLMKNPSDDDNGLQSKLEVMNNCDIVNRYFF